VAFKVFVTNGHGGSGGFNPVGAFNWYSGISTGWLDIGRQRAARQTSVSIPRTTAQAPAAAITTSPDLPGSAHWDPATVPVGGNGKSRTPSAAVILGEGTGIPVLGPWWELPSKRDTREPPIIYSPPPILLPGQTDPGREEREEEGEVMAHTWTHVGSQFIGALFPGSQPGPLGFGGPVSVPVAQPSPPISTIPSVAAYSGSCPPRKTRTLTIDCETGEEVKRKRRRRPKLLTNGDMGMLFQIASLPNNANVRIALAGAIRR